MEERKRDAGCATTYKTGSCLTAAEETGGERQRSREWTQKVKKEGDTPGGRTILVPPLTGASFGTPAPQETYADRAGLRESSEAVHGWGCQVKEAAC